MGDALSENQILLQHFSPAFSAIYLGKDQSVNGHMYRSGVSFEKTKTVKFGIVDKVDCQKGLGLGRPETRIVASRSQQVNSEGMRIAE
jgi:hypothetical protein